MGQSQAGPGAHTCPWQAGLRAVRLGVGRPGFASQIVHLAARGPGACGFPLSLSDLVRLEGSRPASPGAPAPGPSHSRKSRHPLAPPGSPAHTKGSLCPCCTLTGCGHVSLPTGLLREQQGGWQAGCSPPPHHCPAPSIEQAELGRGCCFAPFAILHSCADFVTCLQIPFLPVP